VTKLTLVVFFWQISGKRRQERGPTERCAWWS
jgi:hypothetical protein